MTGTSSSTYGVTSPHLANQLDGFTTTGSLTVASTGATATQNYSGVGNITTRTTALFTDTTTWDGMGRLLAVNRRDASNNGFNLTSIYDGLGRRLQTSQQPIAAGSATGSPLVIKKRGNHSGHRARKARQPLNGKTNPGVASWYRRLTVA